MQVITIAGRLGKRRGAEKQHEGDAFAAFSVAVSKGKDRAGRRGSDVRSGASAASRRRST